MAKSRWSESVRHSLGTKPGQALVKWLNDSSASPNYIETLLRESQLVCEWLDKCGSIQKLNVARKQKKLPPEFWEAHTSLNQKLASFIHAPQIDLHDLGEGERLSWMLVSEEPSTALFRVQLRCILQLIDQNAILKVRRCSRPECAKWYFARRSDQEFCSGLCRWKAFATTETFKARRRAKAKETYHLKKSGKVK